jgi:Protein of unknown function (DUF998)
MYDSTGCSSPLALREVLLQAMTGLEGATNKGKAKSFPGLGSVSQLRESAAWLAVLLTGATILLLAALHVLSPEFSPSWRVISEYAFGSHAWVLSLMFLCMGASSWAAAAAIWSDVHGISGKAGLWLLLIAGLGGTMAAYFDITHEIGHAMAGFLGVIGFPIAALLLSVALGRNENWRTARARLLWFANLSWISVVLLVATLAIMTMQVSRLNGGHLPQHAPKALPPGVLALDGWADRLIVVCNCAWVLVAAWQAIQMRRKDLEAGGR